MTIESHIEEFAGFRVRDYVPAKGIVDPSHTAYRVTVDSDDVEIGQIQFKDVLTKFLFDRNIGKLKALVIGTWHAYSDMDSSQIVEFLVSKSDKLKNLSALFLGDIVRSEQEISWIRQSDLSALWAAFPKLKHFHVRGGEGLGLGRIRHDGLRSLVVESGGLRREVVQQVATALLPRLEHLELWLGAEWYGGDATVEDVEPLLSETLFPKLKTLGIRNFRFADEFAQKIAVAPVLKQLKVLDLSLGTLGDEGAQALLDSPHIRGLKKLDVHHHYMSNNVMEELSRLPMEVDVSQQYEPDSDEDDPEERYVAISE
ncbi:MAG: STM4015 family protein [Planctomycetaceae bacterium]|nr:STM4015 family protein [Planctomycetaceae bacterium]